MRPSMEWDDAIRRQDAQEAYNDAWDDAHREQERHDKWKYGVPWPYGNAPLPAGHYKDVSLMPLDGPECCENVVRLSCNRCEIAYTCPVHGEWHFQEGGE